MFGHNLKNSTNPSVTIAKASKNYFAKLFSQTTTCNIFLFYATVLCRQCIPQLIFDIWHFLQIDRPKIRHDKLLKSQPKECTICYNDTFVHMINVSCFTSIFVVYICIRSRNCTKVSETRNEDNILIKHEKCLFFVAMFFIKYFCLFLEMWSVIYYWCVLWVCIHICSCLKTSDIVRQECSDNLKIVCILLAEMTSTRTNSFSRYFAQAQLLYANIYAKGMCMQRYM